MLLPVVCRFLQGNKPRNLRCEGFLILFTEALAPEHIFCKELFVMSLAALLRFDFMRERGCTASF